MDFERNFDFYVVFEMFRDERIRHRTLVCELEGFNLHQGLLDVIKPNLKRILQNSEKQRDET